MVENAVKDLKSSPNLDHDKSILEKLVKINEKVAVVMCADALLAGIDTTTVVAVGTLHCLATNQDKQDKLREELQRNLPDPDEALCAENMANLPYLRAVLKESMRMLPPISLSIRRIPKDLVLNGHHVPTGTDVLMALMTSYKSAEHFEQADRFVPERWLKHSDETCPVISRKAHPFAFLPFGFGARVCVGKRIAEMELEVLFTRLIRDYKIEWNYPDLKIKSALLNIPISDLKFKITKV